MSNYLFMSSFTTGFILLAVIKACSSLWLVIKGTLQIGTTSDPWKITATSRPERFWLKWSFHLDTQFSQALLRSNHQLVHAVVLCLRLQQCIFEKLKAKESVFFALSKGDSLTLS